MLIGAFSNEWSKFLEPDSTGPCHVDTSMVLCFGGTGPGRGGGQTDLARGSVCWCREMEKFILLSCHPGSWIGWYTQLNGAVYDAEGAQKSIDESASYNTDWAAEWFCIDTAGKLSKLEQSPWHDRQRYRMLETIHRPVWVGNSQESDSMVTTAAGNDTDRITAWTSYARCRIRARSFDDRTRRKGGEPRDGFEYDVLSSGEQIIGRLYGVDLVSPAEAYYKVRIAEERDNGRLPDLIVISRQKGWSPYAYVKDHVRGMPIPVLNLMMIQLAPDGSEVASRLGVFQIPEKFWINCSPEWRRMTLQ